MGRKYSRTLCLLAAAPAEGRVIDWARAEKVGESLEFQPQPGARWGAVLGALASAQKFKALESEFAEYLNGVKVLVPTNATLKMMCREDEDAAEFQTRCQAAAWTDFLKALAAETETYVPEFARFGVAIPADEPVRPNTPWAERWQQYLPGSPVRRTKPPTELSPSDRSFLENLEVEWHKAKQTLAERWKRVGEQITDLPLPVGKKSTKVVRFGVAWAPFWMVTNAAGVSGLVPAYR
jgi:hypothetical protein